VKYVLVLGEMAKQFKVVGPFETREAVDKYLFRLDPKNNPPNSSWQCWPLNTLQTGE